MLIIWLIWSKVEKYNFLDKIIFDKIKAYLIAYLWVRVIGCTHDFGYHLTDVNLRSASTTMSYPHCGPITLHWIICRKWQQLPCVPPTSPHCDHDNHAHHHHKPSTLLMGFNRKKNPIVIHQVSPLSLTIFDVVMFHVFTKLNSFDTFHYVLLSIHISPIICILNHHQITK